MHSDNEFSTPMMQQYTEIKKGYPDAILFFRLGDFYEMFMEDAKIGAKVLGITLTARNKGKDGKIPMAGIPYHAAESYITRLVQNGYKVAVCEQVTKPQAGTDIVSREVIRVVTPSTNLNSHHTSEQYLMNFSIKDNRLGICLIGVSNGEVLTTEHILPSNHKPPDVIEILNEYIAKYQPAEILLAPDWYQDPALLNNFHQQQASPFQHQSTIKTLNHAIQEIKNVYQIDSLESFGIQDSKSIIFALATGLTYLHETQHSDLKSLKPPRLIQSGDYMYLSRQTIYNLELLNTIRSGNQNLSLFGVLNKTYTPLGARKLRSWLMRPLLNPVVIDKRLDAVEILTKQLDQRNQIQEHLTNINDIERSLSRLAIGMGNARDLIAIKTGLFTSINIFNNLIPEMKTGYLGENLAHIDWDQALQLATYLNQSINHNPPTTITEGNLIRENYHPELDEIRDIATGGRQKLASLEQRERADTQISTLKIGFNKIFGYFIEVSKTNSHKVPAHYIRRQTLVNTERYIIPELKEHEEKVLTAQEQSHQLEYELYHQIVHTVLDQTKNLHQIAQFIATLDVVQSLAQIAVENNYTRPIINDSQKIDILNGRHPVVEQILGNQFVPNSLMLDPEKQRFMVLTGANMAGKSTFIRQNAVITILAQIGSFVPAEKAEIGIIDHIHTRIGAMDDLSAGLSTFMVEMVETAKILNNLTDRSLVILDEVGRGTSTYDGISIAWAVSEQLIRQNRAKVLFATHYLELAQLEDGFTEVKNAHLAVTNDNQNVRFLYQIKIGPSDQSYGIEVAKQAGLPGSVITRAREILAKLHSSNRNQISSQNKQLQLF